MVRILSSGEIVQDDDPRVSGSSSSGASRTGPQQGNQRARMGYVQNVDENVHYHMPQTGSLFDTLNERLRSAGVPQWHLGPYPVEPIVSLGLLIALLLVGFKGLVLGLLLFFVCKWSQSGNGGGQPMQGFGDSLRRFGLGGGMTGGGGGQATGSGSSGHRGSSGSSSGSSSGHNWSGSGHRLGRS